jgi:hypothetical protein
MRLTNCLLTEFVAPREQPGVKINEIIAVISERAALAINKPTHNVLH